jgi:hypothetical protein
VTNIIDITGIPTKSFAALYHVGELSGPIPGRHSHEGNALSVSECPDAWREICRLGGSPTWEVRKYSNVFLDARRLLPAHITLIHDWTIDEGWVKPARVFRVDWYDDETAETRFSLHPTRQQACYECDTHEDQQIKEIDSLVAQPRLTSLLGYEPDLAAVEDLTLFRFAEAHGFDGVFFNETFDPLLLSAPRAGIVPTQLASWTMKPLTPKPSQRSSNRMRPG